MERVDGLQLKERTLESRQVLSEMTSDEVEFRVNVEDMLSESANAVDRQICIEVRKFFKVCCHYLFYSIFLKYFSNYSSPERPVSTSMSLFWHHKLSYQIHLYIFETLF